MSTAQHHSDTPVKESAKKVVKDLNIPILGSDIEATMGATNPAIGPDLMIAGQLLGAHDHDLITYPSALRLEDGQYVDQNTHRSICLRNRSTGERGDNVSIVNAKYGIATNRMSALPLAALVREGHLTGKISVVEQSDHTHVHIIAEGRVIHTPAGIARSSLMVRNSHDGTSKVRGGLVIQFLQKGEEQEADFAVSIPLVQWSHRHSGAISNHIASAHGMFDEAEKLLHKFSADVGVMLSSTIPAPEADKILMSLYKTKALEMDNKDIERHETLIKMATTAGNINAFGLLAAVSRYQDRLSSFRGEKKGRDRTLSTVVGIRADVKKSALDQIMHFITSTTTKKETDQDL